MIPANWVKGNRSAARKPEKKSSGHPDLSPSLAASYSSSVVTSSPSLSLLLSSSYPYTR